MYMLQRGDADVSDPGHVTNFQDPDFLHDNLRDLNKQLDGEEGADDEGRMGKRPLTGHDSAQSHREDCAGRGCPSGGGSQQEANLECKQPGLMERAAAVVTGSQTAAAAMAATGIEARGRQRQHWQPTAAA